MLSHPKELDSRGVSRLGRAELIARLLDFNRVSAFQFTPAWLRRQWTHRLRSLLLATLQQHQARNRSPF